MAQLHRKRYPIQATLLLFFLCLSETIHLSQGHFETSQVHAFSQHDQQHISSATNNSDVQKVDSKTRHSSFFTLAGSASKVSTSSKDDVQASFHSISVSPKEDPLFTESDQKGITVQMPPIGPQKSQTISVSVSSQVDHFNNDSPSSLQSTAPNKSVLQTQKPSQAKIKKVSKGKYIGKRDKTGEEFPIQIKGGDDMSFFPATPKDFVTDEEEYDVIVVGSGVASMVASTYLTDKNKKILVLEKQEQMGGLAVHRKNKEGIAFGGGASYWDKATGEQLQIMIHIGEDPASKDYSIHEPFDVYLLKGVLYGTQPHNGIWDDRTIGLKPAAKQPNGNGSVLPVLPASFALFKLQCLNADQQDMIPEQPIQLWHNMELDQITAVQWVRQMPQRFYKRIFEDSDEDDSETESDSDSSSSDDEEEEDYTKEKALWARLQQQIKEGVIDRDDPMKEVLAFLELYCHEEFGSNASSVSAMALAYFYTSEFQTRYTSAYGTGLFTHAMLKNLKAKPSLATLKTQAPVINVKNTEDGVEVRYVQKGKGRIVKAKMVYYGSQLGFAPLIIEGLNDKSPEQAKAMKSLQMTHYSVHCACVSNHPYRMAFNTNMENFTDVSVSRWSELGGYKKTSQDIQNHLRWNYTITPDEQGTVFCVWHSLMKVNTSKVNANTSVYGDNYAAEAAEADYNRFQKIFDDANLFGQQFTVYDMITNRWAYGMHTPAPGHFQNKSKLMGQTFGNVVFGNNNLGTPSLEEALYRGHCGANRILYRLDPDSFVQEHWSKCNYKA